MRLRTFQVILLTIASLAIFAFQNCSMGFRATPPAGGASLLARWSMDDGSGLIAHDSAGDNHAAFINYPTWVRGEMAGALNFSQNSWLSITPTKQIQTISSLTLMGWVYVRPGGQRIISFGDTRPVRFYASTPPDSQSIHFFVGYDGTSGEWQTANGSLPLNSWHHYAIAYAFGTSNVPTIYIDGALQSVATLTFPSGNPLSGGGNLYIGGRGDNVANFDGMIDETKLYDGMLSAQDISTLYRSERTKRPNILVIMTDDQDDQGTLDYMPKVKSLLTDLGVHFINSFVVNPLCCSSRASFLTGQNSHNNGVWQNARNGNGFDGGYGALAPTASNTLPVWLQQAGYRTALIGKYLNQYGLDVPRTDVPPGWDQWIGLVDPKSYSYYNYDLNINGAITSYQANESDYQTDVLTQKAVAFISESAPYDKPFFLWLAPLAPHAADYNANYNIPIPAPKYAGRFASLSLPTPPSFNENDISDKPSFMQNLPVMNQAYVDLSTQSYQARREALLSVDDMVEKVVETLKQAGQLDNTVIIFTSDNGYFQGQHRLPIEKRLAYEEAIRVPLVIRGPNFPKQVTSGALVANIDLPATILDIAIAYPNRDLDGRSLLEVFKPNFKWRKELLIEGTNKIPFDTTFYSSYSALRTARYKYVEHKKLDSTIEREFYDLSIDPYEIQNRLNSADYMTVVDKLRDELARVRGCVGGACWLTDSVVPANAQTLSMAEAPSEIGKISGSSARIPKEPGDVEETSLPREARDVFYSLDGNQSPSEARASRLRP